MRRTQAIFTWIGILFISSVIIFPVFWGVRTSVVPKANLDLIPHQFTLENYAHLLELGFITNNVKNSLIIALSSVSLTLPLSLLAGYALARFDFPGKRYSIVLLAMPLLPALAVLVPLIIYIRVIGLYNTLAAVVLAATVFSLPYCTWMIRGFMLSIPREIEEAALIDGCGPLAALWRIAIPLAAPGLIAVGIFTLISAWNNYLFSFAFTTKRVLMVVPAALLGFITAWGENYGGLNAAAVVAMLPVLFFFLLFQKWFIQGMLTGSSK
jgi:N,N'-diacetylchitobiose transport system permease protein